MATSSELFRAAEHMRGQDKAIAEREAHDEFGRGQVAYWVRNMADALEREAKRLQSWPEGWPPFAVLRKAYAKIGMGHWPSTKYLSQQRVKRLTTIADRMRAKWRLALEEVLSEPSSP